MLLLAYGDIHDYHTAEHSAGGDELAFALCSEVVPVVWTVFAFS
jgi:hypothetical protein